MNRQNYQQNSSHSRQRSSSENRYLHAVILPMIARHESFEGWSQAEIKEYLKKRFLSIVKTRNIAGSPADIIISRPSSTLTTVEWEQWMRQIRQWGDRDLKIWIPGPNEVHSERHNFERAMA